MSRWNNSIFAGLLAVALFTAFPVSAATVSYTDQVAWTTAAGTITQFNFDNIAPSGLYTDESTSTGLTIDGAQFVGYVSPTAYQLQVVDSMFVFPYYNFGSGGALRSPTYDRAQNASFIPYIQVNLPANTTAIAADLATVSPNGLAYEIILSDGSSYTVNTQARPNTTFLGITSDTAITYADFVVLGTQYNGGTFGLIKDFSYATSASQGDQVPTPEAATLILIGTGLIAFRWLRKRQVSNLAPA